ncbi:AMP-binding enzyme [Klebsiella pneumoniae]|uniref:AMP-binding enzyme n=1 Tax=Klebsiella pneumoniae TaxID=573 RepID=UPI00192D8041|nr:hypothetical protein [Klebsiella pneumoniae]MEC5522435.1 hypothetical protein [Klebsiella pneumoniae]MEC5559822.1 hypothetical protein [Klebsiella pneumoniae]
MFCRSASFSTNRYQIQFCAESSNPASFRLIPHVPGCIKSFSSSHTYRGVREVAVIPTPSPVYGEEPVAFIVPDGQHHLTSEEILDWLKVKIARFKLPARIIFTRALPRTHNGKVSKQQLKTRLAESIITLSTEDKK